MKGILHKRSNSNNWVVEYIDVKFTQPTRNNGIFGATLKEYVKKELPLSQNPLALPEGVFIEDVLIEGKEVEFEIAEVYIGPSNSIHSNRGSDMNFAKLIFRTTWDDILTEYENSDEREGTFVNFLRKHYNVPTKK